MRSFFGCLFSLLAGSASAAEPAALAERIDQRLATAWGAEKITPAPRSPDAEFLRRVTLDLIGRVPTVAEVNAFLADTKPSKRERLVERLLQTAAHSRQMASFWRKTWLPATVSIASMDDGTDEWVISQLQKKTPYDRVVRDLVIATAPRHETTGPAVPRSFQSINEGKPETLAAAATRAFLGVNLDCAQCHNHPFARWSREQFWETAAFFARPERNALQVKIVGTDKTVSARFLTKQDVNLPEKLTEETGRAVFADWMTRKDNPYFARNAVNRLWSYFFGLGLIEPLDDLSGEVEATVPALLDDLEKAFVESGFDLEYVTRAIVLSEAYQLSSVAPKGEKATDRPKLFSRAAVRGLTGEQLYDSLRIASGHTLLRPDLDPRAVLNERNQFAARFSVERTGTAQRAILQSLALMNGPVTTTLTDPKKAPALVAVADAPFLDTAGKVDALFMAAYGRKATAEESADLVKYVERGGTGERPQRLANIFWALLNSAEFNTNH